MTPPVGKIAFVSPHCVLDFTNGAATATLDGLSLLAGLGFNCSAFCSSYMDAWEEVLVEEILARRKVRYAVRNARIPRPSPPAPLPNTGEGRHYEARMIFTSHGDVPVTLFNSASTRGNWISQEEVSAFLTAAEIFLRKNRPDVVWTYGGDGVSLALHKLVRRLEIPIVFALHNFNYRDAAMFAGIARATVPTEFARRHYAQTIALDCQVLPLVMDGERVKIEGVSPDLECGDSSPLFLPGCMPGQTPEKKAAPRQSHSGDEYESPHSKLKYVTFVNPEPRKGVNIFARIAEVLAARRPDIRLLVVEGAAKTNYAKRLGIDFATLGNVTSIPNTPDPREFYAVTKLIVMPSLMENAGCVAMEAMINGIPVLASNRGGLPETIGEAGFLFDIPAKYTTEHCDLPAAEEVEPWVEMIIRLWDDAAEYERRSQAAREQARNWHPDRVGPIYREFFGSFCA